MILFYFRWRTLPFSW